MLALLPLFLELVPALAGMVAGGGTSTVVDAAAKVARDVFGTEDVEAVKAALADPATAETFRTRLEAETARYTAALADMQNARATTVRLVEAGSAMAWAPVVLSVAILAMVAGVIAAVGFGRLPDNGIVVGWALGSGTTVVAYWLGSSSGSRRNGDAVRALAAGPATLGQAAGRAIDATTRR